MKPFNLIAGKAQAAIAVALLVGAVLSGCGGGNDDHGKGNGGDTPAPVIDAFITSLSDLVSTSSDSTEGKPIDAL